MIRSDFMKLIEASVGARVDSVECNKQAIQALLLMAATYSHSMSNNVVGFSDVHVYESMEAMAKVLEQTFDVAVLS